MTDKQIPKIAARRPASSMPEWAVLERSLIALLSKINCDLVDLPSTPWGWAV
jgi:hypothetical protein